MIIVTLYDQISKVSTWLNGVTIEETVTWQQLRQIRRKLNRCAAQGYCIWSPSQAGPSYSFSPISF